MRRFCKNIFLYLILPASVFVLSGELLLRNIPNDYAYKKQYLDLHSDSIQTLILGPSISYYDINPLFLKAKSFNMAHNSQSIDLDSAILMKYDGKWSNLRWIILSMNYAELSFILGTSKDKWRIPNYVIYYDLRVATQITDYSELMSHFRMSVNKLINYCIYKTDYHTCSSSGWGTDFSFSKQQDLIATGKSRATDYTSKNESIDGNVALLKSVILYAEKRKINVLLYTEPGYHTFVQNIDSNQLNQVIKTSTEFSTNYPNVFYHNFLTDSSFTERDFYDADHLDEFGAEKLTLKIDSIISNIDKRGH